MFPKKTATESAVREGGRVQEMVGDRAGPGYHGPRRPSENFRFLSRAVRSQGKLLSRRASDSLSS